MPFLWDPPQKDFRGPGHRDVSSHVPENGVRTWVDRKDQGFLPFFSFSWQHILYRGYFFRSEAPSFKS